MWNLSSRARMYSFCQGKTSQRLALKYSAKFGPNWENVVHHNIYKDVHTRAWAPACLSRCPAELLAKGRDIDCHAIARSESRIYWAAYITNMGWKSASRKAYLVFAEDTGSGLVGGHLETPFDTSTALTGEGCLRAF